MLKKIKRKITFVYKLVILGADVSSKLILIREYLYLMRTLYFGGKNKPFSCRIKTNGKSTRVFFTGTLNEMHALIDIFLEKNYELKFNHTQTLFSNNIKTLLDLGANIGLTSIWFAMKYPGITIDAYEPNPQIFDFLKKNLASIPGTRVFKKAVTGINGTMEFNQSENSFHSSVFAVENGHKISVESIDLDTAIAKIGGKVDVLKLDIEGAEFKALENSKQLVDIRTIIGEAHTAQSVNKEEDLKKLLSSFLTFKIYNPNKANIFGFYAARTTPTEA